MNENFVYDEFNPKMKGGRASGITEIFQATNSYIKNNIKALLCFALVYIVLIGGFLALNVGSIMQISSEALNIQRKDSGNFEAKIDGLEDFTNELDDAESFDDVMGSIKNFKDGGGLNDKDLNAFMNITRTSTLMILSFLIMGIAVQLIAIAFVTHVNKWIFKMNRGVKDVTESVFIKFIKGIATFVVGGFATLVIALIATGLRAPWVFALAAIPWICATLYSTVYSQMAMCDYTNQYEFRTGRVVRDYDYYDIYEDDGYDYTDKPRRYQDDEARSVDDFYNNLDR